jgi:hypothetical protein
MHPSDLSSSMILKFTILCVANFVCVMPANSEVKGPQFEIFQGGKADAKIREFMTSDWHRQKWQIEKRPIEGLPGSAPTWHVKGTMWRVRIEGPDRLKENFDLDKLDPKLVHEFTGIPVDESYGVITFYLLSGVKKLGSKQSETHDEQAGTGQPATRSESKSEGGDKPQPESEGRSR